MQPQIVHVPRVGDIYVSTQRDHPIPIRISSVGTNHVLAFPVKGKRNRTAGHWIKIERRRLNTHFRQVGP